MELRANGDSMHSHAEQVISTQDSVSEGALFFYKGKSNSNALQTIFWKNYEEFMYMHL